MKFVGIQRAVRATRYDRAPGDSPNMGRVSRMPGTGMPKGSRIRRRKKGADSGTGSTSNGAKSHERGKSGRRRRKSHVRTWSFMIAGLSLCCVFFAIWAWSTSAKQTKEISTSIAPSIVQPVARLLSKYPSPSQRESMDLVKQALQIRDPSQVASCFRPCESSPEEIIEYLRNLEAVDGVITGYDWLSSIDVERILIDGVVILFIKDDKPTKRLALLSPDTEGKWKIDFDALARKSKPSWNDLLEGGALSAQVRVWVAPDSYFNGPFKDDARWICFGISSADIDENLFGYCEVGSAQAFAMSSIFSDETKLARVTLELLRVEGASERQFQISRVIASDWLIGDTAFDEGFK